MTHPGPRVRPGRTASALGRLPGALAVAVSVVCTTPALHAQAPELLPWSVERVASSTGGATPFGSVPPEGVGFGSDGRIYVLDSQAATIYEFDVDLRPLGALGGRGRGPGELIQPSVLAAGSGRVAVYDPGTSRITVYMRGGVDWDAAWPLTRDGIPRRIAVAGDDLLIEVEPFPFTRRGARSYVGAQRLVRLGRSGDTEVLKRFPTLRRSSGMPSADSGPVVFQPELHWVSRAGGEILFSRSDRYRLDVLDPSTGEVDPFASRSTGPARPVSDDVRSLVRSQTLERFVANRGQAPLSRVDEQVMRQSIAEMRFAETLPLTGEIVDGLEGIVLVRRGIGLDDAASPIPTAALTDSPAWDVFRDDGTYAGVLEFPDGFVPRDAFRDLVVGVRVGELGEVAVDVLRIGGG